MILYFECFSGISGDMTVSSLLDLGVDHNVLLSGLKSLNLKGYKVEISRIQKCGIDACNFNVILDKPKNSTHNHSTQKQTPPPHIKRGEGFNISSNISFHYKKGGLPHLHFSKKHSHGHSHGHSNGHSHNNSHSHTHSHEHRNINDITKIINDSGISKRAKSISLDIFGYVARSEAKAHNLPIEKVHFHEVGAVDSIVDIVAVAICIDFLDIRKVCVSTVHEGQGHVKCQHGIIPVPVPAVVNIARESGIPLRITNTRGEMVTPTGMAIIASLKNTTLPTNYSIKSVGLGGGKKDFPHANILRAILIEENNSTLSPQISVAPSEVFVLETNIDDSTGEALGFTMDKLLSAGAKDVYYTPIYMKKNRPATMLSVICEYRQISTMEDIIFSNLTTIGIRKFKCERTTLSREVKTFSTSFGNIKAKVCNYKDKTYVYPEFESVKKICNNSNLDYDLTYTKIKAEINK